MDHGDIFTERGFKSAKTGAISGVEEGGYGFGGDISSVSFKGKWVEVLS